MLGCFLGELKKVLPAVKYDINSEYVKEAYDWFKKQLKDHYTLSIDERNKEEYKHFLEDETKYIYEERRKFEVREKKRNEICDAIGTRFGGYIWSRFAREICVEIFTCPKLSYCCFFVIIVLKSRRI